MINNLIDSKRLRKELDEESEILKKVAKQEWLKLRIRVYTWLRGVVDRRIQKLIEKNKLLPEGEDNAVG